MIAYSRSKIKRMTEREYIEAMRELLEDMSSGPTPDTTPTTEKNDSL